MHDIDAKVVLHMHISSISQQELDHLNIPAERSKMERGETILICFVIDPSLELLVINRFLRELYQLKTDVLKVFETSHMQ